MIKEAKKEMYKVKLEEGKDNPGSIWKLFRVRKIRSPRKHTRHKCR